MTNPNGRFGVHGGQYIPETLMKRIITIKTIPNLTENLLICSMNMQADRQGCTLPKR